MHERLRVGIVPSVVDEEAGRAVGDEADDALVDEVQRAEVGFRCVGGAPKGDVGNEVRVGEHVVELDERGGGEDLVEVLERIDERVELADDVRDLEVVLEVVLDDVAEDLGGGFVFERLIVDGERDVGEGGRVEKCVGGFGGIRYEVVGVEVRKR